MRQDPSRTDRPASLFSRAVVGQAEKKRVGEENARPAGSLALASVLPDTSYVSGGVSVAAIISLSLRPTSRRVEITVARYLSPIDRTDQGVGGVGSEPINRITNSVHNLAWLGGPSATFLRLVFCFRLRHPSCSDEIQAGGEKIGTG